jgi:hypothetical protein
MSPPRCTCSVWANEPRHDCPKHGKRWVQVLDFWERDADGWRWTGRSLANGERFALLHDAPLGIVPRGTSAP